MIVAVVCVGYSSCRSMPSSNRSGQWGHKRAASHAIMRGGPISSAMQVYTRRRSSLTVEAAPLAYRPVSLLIWAP